MARRPRITQASLAKLGVERLSELLVAEAASNKALKQALQLALEAEQGIESLAASIRQRLATIERSESRLSTNKGREMLAELKRLQASIVNDVGKEDPAEGLELLWQLIDLHRSLISRTRDRAGRLGEFFTSAVPELPVMAARSDVDPERIAEQLSKRFLGDVYGVYGDLISMMAEPLKREGLTALKVRLATARGAQLKNRGRSRRQQSIIEQGLRDVADCMGDVDAFIETFSLEQSQHPASAAEMAMRLVAADRAQEALALLDHARPDDEDDRAARFSWTDARLGALEKLERVDECKKLSWQMFETYLSSGHLKSHLKHLPDFDDIETEERALDWVAQHPNFHSALMFLINWPALPRAAAMVAARTAEIHGDYYELLNVAMERLDGRHPLAGVLLRRALIEFTLKKGRKHRYKQMARYVLELQSLDAAMPDYGEHEDHKAFLEQLWLDHLHNAGFWSLLE